MTTYVLDTTALVGLERDRRRLVRLLAHADAIGAPLRTVAPALTEFLGGAPPARREGAAWVSSSLRIDPVDEGQARRAAALRQRAVDAAPASGPSAIDAIVAAAAEEPDSVLIIDGDADDFAALASASAEIDIALLSDL